jgi:putative membrane protein
MPVIFAESLTASTPISRRFLLVAAAAAASGCAGTGGGRAGWGRLAADDRVFAMRAAGAGLYEVAAGRLGALRGTQPEVRNFGQLIADHHGGAAAELAALLQARGLQPPGTLPAHLDVRLSRIANATPQRFDSHFVRWAGLEDHWQQIALHEHAARDVQDGALRDWFARQLPMLRSHLAAAQSLAAVLPA